MKPKRISSRTRVPAAGATTAFDVVVLAASAGGEAAVLSILTSLPRDFAVPVVVMQHLPPDSTVAEFYAKRVRGFDVQWLEDGQSLLPRTVLVCPPRSFVELLPDGSCRLRPCHRGAVDRPMDRLLDSVARSFGHRAIGVVLTGMGSDAAVGAHELHLAGGRMVVQSEDSAQSSEMPRAAIAAGAADLVVALPDIAQVLSEVVAGTPRPKARSELDAIRRIFGAEGEIAARARDIDWAATPLGSVVGWPAELRLMARTTVESAHPTAIWWGPQLIQIYNEPWRQFLGASKHPDALGRPARETWPEIWDEIGPMVERVMKQGIPTAGEDHLIIIDRHGYPEEVYFTFAYSPVRDASGAVVGVHHTAAETTSRVLAERRLGTLRALAAQIAGAATPRQACEQAAAALDSDPLDLPFALLYLVDSGRKQATLAGATGVAPGSPGAPRFLTLADDHAWPVQGAMDGRADAHGVLLHDLASRFPGVSLERASPHIASAPHSAFVAPLRLATSEPIGVLVVALNPHRPFDDAYRTFIELIAQQVNAGIIEARAKQLERERADRLAELDRAKTDFFANVSHEFRTPLTLLLTPLEHILGRRDELPAFPVGEIEIAARNARRLLRLVDNLLDFSQIEHTRQRAVLEPTDLGALTADIASAFRSAIETAGLKLQLSCDPKLPLVPVHREMWEKIVSNLLSNALKFTFEGEIRVELHALALHAELVVTDTGIGIPDDELPNLFKRFHRVRGARARTIEGSGIGLSIVHDLVTRMGGQLTVRSREAHGSSFTIWLPYRSHRQIVDAPSVSTAPGTITADLAEEASRWVAGESEPPGVADDLLGEPSTPGISGPVRDRVVVIDDNADLRTYLRRLLGPRWNVELAADGTAGLDLIRRLRPALVLADVMMPGVDGFALVRQIRGDPELKHTPVLLLSARAGEQAAIDGLLAGADDYIAKPFSPRELVARVRGQIELSRMRRRAGELNALLVRFSDAVRGLTDARAIADTACRMIVDQLGAERAHWAEIDESTREYVVESRFVAQGVADTSAGRHPLDAWQPFTSMLAAGRTSSIDDAQADPLLPAAVKDAMARLGIAARLAVPVMAHGKLCAVQAVHQCSPRRWTPEEIALVEGVAARCWAEMERARAEHALRASEARLAIELSDAQRLQRISGLIGGDDAALYDHILDAARALMRADMASIQMLSPERNALCLLAHHGFAPGSAAHWQWVHPDEASSCSVVLARREPVIVPDVERWELVTGTEQLAPFRLSGIRAMLSAPLISRDGRLVGVISTHWRDPHESSQRELCVLDVLARQAADLIERRMAEQALRTSEQR